MVARRATAAAAPKSASASASASTACAGSGAGAGGLLRRPRARCAVRSISSVTANKSSLNLQEVTPEAFAAVAAPRCFSSTATNSGSDNILPTRHSRHLPRPVCTDAAELESMTSSLLSSRPGSLFTYEFNSAGKGKADEYEAGLARSDTTTQKFEWTLGGHAAAIPGTTNASNTAGADNNNSDNTGSSKQHLDAMVELLERIEEEGRIYVELRARVLNQQFGTNTSGDNNTSNSSSDCNDSSDSDSDSDTDNTSSSTAKSQSAWRIQSLINRYGAAPGPSIYMYDSLLDAIACCAEAEQDTAGTSSMSSMEYLTLARSVYERAMARHRADGGPNANNRHTMPTLITYNAVLRTCAAVEYNGESEQVRDAALDLAFVAYDALNANAPTDAASTSNAVSKNKSTTNNTTNTTMPKRNSATYAHMLRVIAKYLPPSPTRGNVAYGLWLSCTGHDGVLDRNVIQAYVEANTRNGSNGAQYDAFVAKLAGVENNMQENDVLRQNWWRNRKSRRMSGSMNDY